jgi:lipopolysaccharide transport system ATP-binding protein
MSDVAIRVDGLSKQYRVGVRDRYRTLRDVLAGAAQGSWRLLSRNGASSGADDNLLWALRDLSFEVPAGQVLGVIGRNGAGKSTLLKILSRIVEPTHGMAEIHGRVGSLLEVGTGFHPELTGRENIFLNGAILGMRKVEIERKFDEIVAFAELDRFLDTAVKYYSSGMYMRLAFAVAAHLETQILLVDEVLAVGDVAFQKKCLGKMGDVAQSGRTVVFVSHHLDAVQRLCTRCIMLAGGRLAHDGPSTDVVRAYLSGISVKSRPNAWIDLRATERQGTGEVRFSGMQYASDNENIGYQPYTYGPLEVALELEADEARSVGSIALNVYSQLGTKLVNVDTLARNRSVRLSAGRNQVRIRIDRLLLNPGVYRVGLWVSDPLRGGRVGAAYDFLDSAFEIEVLGTSGQLHQTAQGVVPCDFTVLDS